MSLYKSNFKRVSVSNKGIYNFILRKNNRKSKEFLMDNLHNSKRFDSITMIFPFDWEIYLFILYQWIQARVPTTASTYSR